MRHPSLSAGPLPSAAIGRSDLRVGGGLVVASILLNFALCFASTKGFSVGAGLIADFSLLIVFLAALESFRAVDRRAWIACAAVIASLIELKLLNPDLDLKIVFDLSIPVVFFILGQTADPKTVRTMVALVAGLVLAVGLVEWLASDFFQSQFNVWDYYVSKGALGTETVNYSDTSFAINGVRSADVGRTTFSWLFGVHRISSVFLEPISMGNFAIIVLIWTVCMERGSRQLWLLLISGACVVLPDSRFALGTSLLLATILLFRLDRYAALWSAFPALLAAALFGWGYLTLAVGESPAVLSDDLKGRLQFSGKLLASWTPGNWLALTPSATYTADTGYAYLINNAGLPITVALLWSLIAITPLTAVERRFKALMGVYMATTLCVGASFFSIKTASLLWYLYGHVHASGMHEARRPFRARVHEAGRTDG